MRKQTKRKQQQRTQRTLLHTAYVLDFVNILCVGISLPTTRNVEDHIIIIRRLPATQSWKRMGCRLQSCRSQMYVTAQYKATKAVEKRAVTAKQMATVRRGPSGEFQIRLKSCASTPAMLYHARVTLGRRQSESKGVQCSSNYQCIQCPLSPFKVWSRYVSTIRGSLLSETIRW